MATPSKIQMQNEAIVANADIVLRANTGGKRMRLGSAALLDSCCKIAITLID